MNASLQLNTTQQLAMTPQLQQAIRLLQLSTFELQQEIQEALDSNPLLDIEDELISQQEDLIPLESDPFKDPLITTPERSTKDSCDEMENNTISNELDIDANWDDIYSSNAGSTGLAIENSTSIYQDETTESLQDYLMWQVNLTPFTDIDRVIATTIIESLNEYGYLTLSLENILESLGNDNVEISEVETVLKRVQQFDPLGIASRDLSECLLLQLSMYPNDTPWLKETKYILTEHINLLGSKNYRQLMTKIGLKEENLKQIIMLIRQLTTPHPGSRIMNIKTEYIIPDVFAFKRNNHWAVTTNSNSIPRLKINTEYATLAKTIRKTSDEEYIRTNLQEAKWFIKSLESRNETLLKVSNCIIEHQQDFFEYGEEAMKPMTLNDIALKINMHESTISRVTTKKFIHTPRGIFELKYFFSSHINMDNGGECSSTAIRALIKKQIAREDQLKPLSDNKIATLLAEQGVRVARRTVAKYRESLGIAPSNQRKRLF